MSRKWQFAALTGAMAVAMVMVLAAELFRETAATGPLDAPTRHGPVAGKPPSAAGDISTP